MSKLAERIAARATMLAMADDATPTVAAYVRGLTYLAACQVFEHEQQVADELAELVAEVGDAATDTTRRR